MTSKAYNDAIKTHDAAIKAFKIVRDAFRAGECSDEQFLEAQRVRNVALAAYDKAYEHEERYGSSME